MNEMLAPFFSSGRVVDVAIGITVLEGLALAAYYRVTGSGVSPRYFALNMLSGICLMLALRSALVGANWGVTALFLSASGVIHVLDIFSRWRRTGRQPYFR